MKFSNILIEKFLEPKYFSIIVNSTTNIYHILKKNVVLKCVSTQTVK